MILPSAAGRAPSDERPWGPAEIPPAPGVWFCARRTSCSAIDDFSTRDTRHTPRDEVHRHSSMDLSGSAVLSMGSMTGSGKEGGP